MSFESVVEDAAAGRARLRDGVPVFVASGPPVTRAALAEAERRLGVPLPKSYRWFVERAGPGTWCGEEIPAPEDLYPFDEDVGPEMEGMIAVVWNADGTGDYLAFKPVEARASADPPLYLCSHDPFGCNLAAPRFADWATGRYAAALSGDYFYAAAYDLMDRKLAEERRARGAARKWWQFWK